MEHEIPEQERLVTFQEGMPMAERGMIATREMRAMITDLMAKAGGDQFAEMLGSDTHIYRVAETVASHLEKIKIASPEKIIREMRIIFKDFLAAAGINMVEFQLEARDQDGNKMLLDDERDSPTVGLIPENKRAGSPYVIGLKSGPGEEMVAVSKRVTARGYLPGERMMRTSSVGSMRKNDKVKLREGEMIGVRVADKAKLKDSGLPYAKILRDDLQKRKVEEIRDGQVFWRRALTGVIKNS